MDETRLRSLIRLKLYLKDNERIRYFVPNEGQEKFIQEISRPGAFIVINASGNGAGKTYGLVAVLAALCWPKMAPPCFSSDLFQDWPHPKRARICSTPKELEEIGSLQTAIRELFPKDRYEAVKKGKFYPSQFKTDTGWVIDLMSYEQDKSEMTGPTLGLLIWNEPMPQELWNEGLARMRRGGLIIGAMTSLLDHPWVVDGILNKADGGNVRVIYSDIETNCKIHGRNGVLDHDQIEKILSQYDPDEREARKTGKPLSFSGRILKSFNRDIHVSREILRPDGNVSVYQVVDPAIGKPLAVIWAYADASGTVHVFNEWPEFDFEGARDSNLTVSDYGDIFKSRESGFKVQERILDRHFGNVRRTLGGQTLKEEFGDSGLDFLDSYTMDPSVEVETGILKIKEYLKYDPYKKIDSLNHPRLLVSPNCRNTIASLERWSRDPATGKPRQEYKDFSDCVRYLVMAEPRWEPEKKWSNPKLPHYGVG